MKLGIAVTKKIMKFKFICFGLFYLLLLFPNFSFQENTSHLKRKWMLIELDGFSKEFLVHQNAYLDLSTSSELKIIKINCNTVDVKMIVHKNYLRFKLVGSKTTNCKKNIELKKAFIDFLLKENTYKIQGHFLTIKDNKGNMIKLIAEDWD